MASSPVYWSSTSLLLSTSISTSTSTSIRRPTTLSPPPNWGSSSSSFSSLRCDFRASAAHFSLQPLNKNPLLNINSSSSSSSFIHPHLEQGSSNGGEGGGDGGDGNNNNGNNNNNNNHGWDSFGDFDGWWGSWSNNMDMGPFIFMFSLLGFFLHSQLGSSAFAITDSSDDNKKEDVVWEVRGGKWIKLLPDPSNDTFVIDESNPLSLSFGLNLWSQCRNLFMQLMLPEGYPNSVSSDYLEYSLWRGVQGIASQVSGVLSTQALLYAVGLGKGAIPTAAAISWVLKDGIGYLSKILLSKYGRHFDVHPKGWRLFADLLENGAYGLELLTPAFPHLFVLIGAAAGASRSAASLIQAATRSCFYAGFAAQRNFAEVIAKGEAQGMVSQSFGIMLGIALANCIGSSTPLAFASFTVITGIHMFCNLKSYQSIQLRTLNPYRASLVFSEYLLSGQVPPIKEVNDEEPLFPVLHLNNVSFASKEQPLVLSEDAKDAAAQIEHRLQLGSKLSEVINSKEDAMGLFDLYKNEAYILTRTQGSILRKYKNVVLKEGATAQDMLKSLFHVNYLYWLEKNVGIMLRSSAEDCRPGGKLQMSLDYVQREFNHVKHDGSLSGWVTDGLIARALPNRICLDFAASAPKETWKITSSIRREHGYETPQESKLVVEMPSF